MIAELRRALFILASLMPAALAATESQNCGCACCEGKPACCCKSETAVAASETKRYPVRGVITAVYADRSALMVKHEEIPGLMRPMTMLFKVDEPTLKAAKKGQTITAQLSRQGDDWWLHDVKVEKES